MVLSTSIRENAPRLLKMHYITHILVAEDCVSSGTEPLVKASSLASLLRIVYPLIHCNIMHLNLL